MKLTKKKINFIFFLLIFVGINYMFFIRQIVRIIPRFSKYLSNDGVINTVGTSSVFLLLDLLIIIVSIYFVKWNGDRSIKFLSILTYIYIILMFLSGRFNYIDRVAIL